MPKSAKRERQRNPTETILKFGRYFRVSGASQIQDGNALVWPWLHLGRAILTMIKSKRTSTTVLSIGRAATYLFLAFACQTTISIATISFYQATYDSYLDPGQMPVVNQKRLLAAAASVLAHDFSVQEACYCRTGPEHPSCLAATQPLAPFLLIVLFLFPAVHLSNRSIRPSEMTRPHRLKVSPPQSADQISLIQQSRSKELRGRRNGMLAYKILTLTCLLTMPDLLIILVVTIISFVSQITGKELGRVPIERQPILSPTWQRNAGHLLGHGSFSMRPPCVTQLKDRSGLSIRRELQFLVQKESMESLSVRRCHDIYAPYCYCYVYSCQLQEPAHVEAVGVSSFLLCNRARNLL
ncbi:hypothetical protein CCUS01_13153 [Colletotrichum cuscutae]|uniref:Uncharacterized protein n=1 Tax=Colletotrichum cuscutae TaxID=1209917 RepID=A0AAI9YCH7_9PEZI|nr:hypothetical protein CCUS01_13153 [Colletotrichum cuscutae]